jgi:hypothetical protein
MIFSSGQSPSENIITSGNITPNPPRSGSINDKYYFLNKYFDQYQCSMTASRWSIYTCSTVENKFFYLCCRKIFSEFSNICANGGRCIWGKHYIGIASKAGESQPRAPGQNDDWWTRAPFPSRLSHWLYLIAINERIASELLARNRRITVKTRCERCSANSFCWENYRKIVYFTFGTFYDRLTTISGQCASRRISFRTNIKQW